MKANLAQYLREYRDKSFGEVPFSEVDALVLSQLSYLKLAGIVPGFRKGSGVSLEEMNNHPDRERMFSDPVYGEDHRLIFGLVSGSRRYGRLRAHYYMEWCSEEQEAQFSAVTFFLGETSIFVSFRGTDDTLVGWKEDFNMGYMKSVPSQRMGAAYLKGAARYTHGRIILGGHSKGGNIAVYAAAYAPAPIQSRIRRIYSFDGPGFAKGFYEKPGFMRIRDRYCKIVPEQSVVGMLLANDRDYRVVRSYRSGLAQHDLMQWKIRDGRFVYCSDVYSFAGRKAAALNAWIDSLTAEQAASFVNTLYEVICSSQIATVYAFIKTPVRVLYTVIRSFRRLDRDRRRMFLRIIRLRFVGNVI